ncbi:MAG: hypothetical protein F6K22_29955 [Okeania sp. SIO2F4]|nr:hypothetical protein [Okeania sp. SIO2F4]
MTNEQLQELITRICNNPNLQSAQRRKDVNRLLHELSQLPGLYKYSHPLYLEALDQTLLWVSQNICKFQPKQPNLPLRTSLRKWINSYIYWRMRDLYVEQAQQDHDMVSLDVPINDDSENPLKLLDQLSVKGFYIPTGDGFECYIEKCQRQRIQKIIEQLERYVEEDPEGRLKSCHPRQHPNCNCQFLCQRLLFQYPPDKKTKISRELGINYNNLQAFWKRKKCQQLLQQILEELGYSKDE